MFHPALYVVDLKLLAPLGHQLMFVETGVVQDCVFLAFVEMVQGEGALVWGGGWLALPSGCHCD